MSGRAKYLTHEQCVGWPM